MAEPEARPPITMKRRGTCIVEHLNPGRIVKYLNPGRARAVAECCHERVWGEGAPYGLEIFEACQPCVEGACPSPKHG